jgi:hypothetical protein
MKEFIFFNGIIKNFNDLVFVDNISTLTFKNSFKIIVIKINEHNLYETTICEPNGDVATENRYLCCNASDITLIMKAVQKV